MNIQDDIKNQKICVLILSFSTYCIGLFFLIFTIKEIKYDSNMIGYINKTHTNNWLVNRDINIGYWIPIITINMFMGGCNICNLCKFPDILFMFLSTIIGSSFLLGLYSIIFTWYANVFFTILYIINSTLIFRVLNNLYKKKNQIDIINVFEEINSPIGINLNDNLPNNVIMATPITSL